MKNRRGVFSLPWNVERGVWELFFEVGIVKEVKEECDKLKEVVVAELLAKEGDKDKGGKLVLRRGVLGIQVEKSQPYTQKLSFIYLVLPLGAETFLVRWDYKETLLLSIIFENITQQVLFCCED